MPGSITKLSSAARRTARNSLAASTSNIFLLTPRIILFLKSFSPENGSMNFTPDCFRIPSFCLGLWPTTVTNCLSSAAMAFMVKSRRARSDSMLSAKEDKSRYHTCSPALTTTLAIPFTSSSSTNLPSMVLATS